MFRNVYEHRDYAASYAELDWQGTYFLIKRDLPNILKAHVTGRRTLDFGCGAGRSTRFLRALGFDAEGVDISPAMLEQARRSDPHGTYRLLSHADLDQLSPAFDLVLAAFPFDNIPSLRKLPILQALRKCLTPAARFVNIVSSPEIYRHEWVTFSTRDYPENAHARDGDVVRIITRDFRGSAPAEDILCTDDAYAEVYRAAGLARVAAYRPLGHPDDGVDWVSESRIAPWVIHVLEPDSAAAYL